MKPLITTLTPELVCTWNPCESYTYKKLKELGNGGITIEQALDLPIPDADKLWLLLRREIIPEKDLILLVCKYAKRVLHIYEKKYPGDMRPRNAIKTRELFARGKATEKEMAAARAAARDAAMAAAMDAARAAARAAAMDAAWDAAMDAAMDAAWDAAMDAARDAARAAAMDAAWDAAMDAEQKAQVYILRQYFRRGWV
jgi:hypothetical protein